MNTDGSGAGGPCGRPDTWRKLVILVVCLAIFAVPLVAACSSPTQATSAQSGGTNASAATPASNLVSNAPPQATRVDVVYFHRTQRCYSCQWVGGMTLQTIQAYFAKELASGVVTVKEVDVQKEENAALARKFKASGSSLFLNYVRNGVDNIKEATKTYAYVGNEDLFAKTLRTLVLQGLGGS